MADATLDEPTTVTASHLDIEEIIIRPRDGVLSVFFVYLDSNGDTVEVEDRPRSVRVENTEEFPTLFQQAMAQ